MPTFHPSRWSLLAGTVLLITLAGCGDRSESGESDGMAADPEPGGTAVIAVLADLGTPSPLVAQTELDGSLSSDLLYMQLVRGAWEDGRLVHLLADASPMALARNYDYIAPDSTSIRFRMRSDARWSDGQPITAEDVVFTYEMAAEPDLASVRQDYVERIDSVTAEDDSTVVIHFAERYPLMITHSSLAIIPEHVFAGTDPGEFSSHPALLDPAGGKLVVSGAFMIGDWRKGQSIELVPNPYFRPRPHLDRIVFRIIPESTTRTVELQTGAVDFVKNVPLHMIPEFEAGAPHIRFELEPQRNYDYVSYSPDGFEPFADGDIRRALGLAINVPDIINALQMEEYAAPAGGPYAPIFRELSDPERMAPLEQDTAAANRILDEAGWRDSDGDGIRDRNGEPFAFTLVTNAGNQRRADVSQIVQQQWREVGVDAELRSLEFNTFMTNLVEGDYEAALGGWVTGLTPDISPLFGSDSPYNVTGYSNPAVDSLFATALSQPTPEAAAPYWTEAAAGIVEDQPYTWLYYIDTVDGVNQRLRGMRIDTYGSLQNAWEWWIPVSQQGGGASADTTTATPGDRPEPN
jgi:peptide/nickel transport system substrate-binding protein